MKNLTWIIIALVVAIGGYTYYSNQQAQEAARVEAAKVAAQAVAAAEKKAKDDAAAAAVAVAKKAKDDAAAAAAKQAKQAAAAKEKAAQEAAAKAAMPLPFGSDADAGFAAEVWQAMLAQKLTGPGKIHTAPYEGTEPHGMMLETFLSKATIGGHTGDLIVKRNYGPAGVTVDQVRANPDKHLGAITVMFRRKAGFDPETKNWFWAKFLPDGSLDKNPKGVRLAGKIAKGMDVGCIACHSAADGEDFVYFPRDFALAAADKAAAEQAAAKAKAAAAKSAAKSAKAAMVPPFGEKSDIGFAGKIWSAMVTQKLAGPDEIHSAPYEGTEPHGMMLELFVSKATIDGRTGDLIVKRNFGPAGVTKEEVTNNPDKHLGAITVMFRREAGFDPADKNWFWAKFLPDGSLDKNPKGMSLAGKVAKGADVGCIACHSAADGGDMVYSPVVFK